MSNLRILVVFVVLSGVFYSCLSHKPIATTRSTSHNGSLWVTPGWQTKRTFWGHGWPYIMGATAGVIIGAHTPFTMKKNGVSDTLSKGNAMLAGGATGTILFGLILEGTKRKKNNLPKRAFSEHDTEKWVRAYKGNWVAVDWKSPNLKIVPRKHYAAYMAEEKAIKEREEQKKREAEKEALRQQEMIAYKAIQKGIPEKLDDYLNTFKDGAHFAEIQRLAPGYSLYRQAINGQLNEIKAYLARTQTDFGKEHLKSKIPLLESYEANSNKRLNAINAHLGIGQKISSAQCKNDLEVLLKNDALASYWRGYFLSFGTSQYPTDEILGKMIIDNALASPTYQASLNYPETVFASALYMLTYSTKGNVRSDAEILLASMARKQTYLPALYYYGIFLYASGNYEEAEKILLKAYELNLKKASTALGTLYANKKYPGYNLSKGIRWLTLGSEHGDEEAALKLANLYYGGEDIRPDLSAAIKWAAKAENMGSSAALVFLGKLYLTDHQDQPHDYSKALQYLRKAADLNDREGMYILGLLSLEGDIPGFRDDKQALFLLKKAAEAGHPQSMLLIGKIYDEGKLTAPNVIKSRYWLTKAGQLGVGRGAFQPEVASPLASIFKHGDFSTTYTVTSNYYTGQELYRTPNTASDFFSGIISGAFNSWLDRETNTQKVINGLELMYTKGGVSVYGGTITSSFTTSLNLRYGQNFTFRSSGVVSAGAFAGNSGPDGISGFQNYSIASHFRHMAILGRIDTGIKDDSWFMLGSKTEMTVPAGGKLILAVNDRDYRNNQGYFDIEITVEDQ